MVAGNAPIPLLSHHTAQPGSDMTSGLQAIEDCLIFWLNIYLRNCSTSYSRLYDHIRLSGGLPGGVFCRGTTRRRRPQRSARQRRMVGLLTPKQRRISSVSTPSPAKANICARRACFCDVLPLEIKALSRSPGTS